MMHSTFGAPEIGVAAGHGEPVCLSSGRYDVYCDVHVEVANYVLNDLGACADAERG